MDQGNAPPRFDMWASAFGPQEAPLGLGLNDELALVQMMLVKMYGMYKFFAAQVHMKRVGSPGLPTRVANISVCLMVHAQSKAMGLSMRDHSLGRPPGPLGTNNSQIYVIRPSCVSSYITHVHS